jgi:hypothetical protein
VVAPAMFVWCTRPEMSMRLDIGIKRNMVCLIFLHMIIGTTGFDGFGSDEGAFHQPADDPLSRVLHMDQSMATSMNPAPALPAPGCSGPSPIASRAACVSCSDVLQTSTLTVRCVSGLPS